MLLVARALLLDLELHRSHARRADLRVAVLGARALWVAVDAFADVTAALFLEVR